VDDDADVCARAPHVEREHVLLSQEAGEPLGCDHPAGGAGHHGVDRRFAGGVGAHRTAI